MSTNMLAIDLINVDIPLLKPTDTVGQALVWMQDNRLEQLILADEHSYLGIIDENTLLNYDDECTLEHVPSLFPQVQIQSHQHIYEIANVLSLHEEAKIIGVVENDQLIGCITAESTFRHFALLLGAQEQGAILEIAIKERDYSLSEITRLIESNQVKVLSAYLSGSMYTLEKPLTLFVKLNQTDIGATVATLERFGYMVQSAYANEPVESVDQQRFDLLMKYLNM